MGEVDQEAGDGVIFAAQGDGKVSELVKADFDVTPILDGGHTVVTEKSALLHTEGVMAPPIRVYQEQVADCVDEASM